MNVLNPEEFYKKKQKQNIAQISTNTQDEFKSIYWLAENQGKTANPCHSCQHTNLALTLNECIMSLNARL